MTLVEVFLGGEFRVVLPHVWKFQAGSFVEIMDSRIRADIGTAREPETLADLHDLVWIEVPDDIRGPLSVPIRVQALAEGSEDPEIPDELDRLPDSDEGSVNIRLIPPEYPFCRVSPDSVRPGAFATVEVSRLIPNRSAHVVLGVQDVASGRIDGEGNLAPYQESDSDKALQAAEGRAQRGEAERSQTN